MNVPQVVFGAETVSALASWLRQITAAIVAGWNVEHRSDGSHDWHPRDVAYSATTYSGGDSMTWTVGSSDVLQHRYARLGNFLWWSVVVVSSTVGGTPSNNLRITLPGGLRAKGAYQVFALGRCMDNATYTDTVGQIASTAPNVLAVYRQDAANWAAAANTTEVQFTILVEVE